MLLSLRRKNTYNVSTANGSTGMNGKSSEKTDATTDCQTIPNVSTFRRILPQVDIKCVFILYPVYVYNYNDSFNIDFSKFSEELITR